MLVILIGILVIGAVIGIIGDVGLKGEPRDGWGLFKHLLSSSLVAGVSLVFGAVAGMYMAKHFGWVWGIVTFIAYFVIAKLISAIYHSMF